jgi:hypothetical protein
MACLDPWTARSFTRAGQEVGLPERRWRRWKHHHATTVVDQLLLARVERMAVGQISTCMSPFVERTWNVLPHPQVTVATGYSGWISVFTDAP